MVNLVLELPWKAPCHALTTALFVTVIDWLSHAKSPQIPAAGGYHSFGIPTVSSIRMFVAVTVPDPTAMPWGRFLTNADADTSSAAPASTNTPAPNVPSINTSSTTSRAPAPLTDAP